LAAGSARVDRPPAAAAGAAAAGAPGSVLTVDGWVSMLMDLCGRRECRKIFRTVLSSFLFFLLLFFLLFLLLLFLFFLFLLLLLFTRRCLSRSLVLVVR